jgi:hypothetical protein
MTSDNISNDPEAAKNSDRNHVERREVRMHCRITVQFTHGSINDYGICWNLGQHGMYIEYDGDVIEGAPIEVSFVISDEYPLLVEAVGRVAWINIGKLYSQKQTPEGFGVEFVTISEDARLAVTKIIELH